MNKISQFPQIMGIAINFVIFPLSSPTEVGIRSCRFHAAAGPGTRVSFMCVALHSPDHKALTCKRFNRVKSHVSNERMETEIMSNFLHLKIGLAQDYGISSAFANRTQISDHKSIYDLLNFDLLPGGNWTPSLLCTFADYNLTTLELSLTIPRDI